MFIKFIINYINIYIISFMNKVKEIKIENLIYEIREKQIMLEWFSYAF